MSKCAWVTLTTNDAYSLGAMVLAHSLKRVGTVHDLVVMITPTVSEAMRSRLREVFNLVQEVNVLDSKDATNLAILARPELGITFTKLHAWKLVQYQKCVFLDSDTLVIQNADELMEREELSAAPEVCWPDCFNSGVFVYRPNEATFTSIIEFAAKNGSFDGGDQGVLNSYFSEWAHTDINKHLPYTYNTAAFAVYSYLPAFKEFKDKIKILHFAGKMKPWLLNFNSESKQACVPSMFAHAAEFIQLWWNIFCDKVHQSLTDQMSHWPVEDSQNNTTWTETHHNNPNLSSSPSVSNYDSGNFFDDIQPYHDPWEDYYEHLEKLKEQNFSNHNETFSQHKSPSPPPPAPQNMYSSEQHQDKNSNYIPEIVPQQAQSEPQNHIHHESHHIQPRVEEVSHHENERHQNELSFNANLAHSSAKQQEMADRHWEEAQVHSSRCQTIMIDDSATHRHRTLSESEFNQALNEALLDEEDNQIELNLDSSAITVSSTCSDDQDSPVATQNDSNNEPIESEAGLAGALSQVRLGEPRSSEQEAYEASMRRQCWEVGNIDYTGRDSFDNIWKKITETLESKPEAPAKSADGQLTSAEIEDGKVEYDPVTKAKTLYKHIEGGYEVHITIPQQNGTVKTQVKTFYDPKPVTEEELLKQQQEKKKRTKKSSNQVVQIDKNTTMITREIPGGYEEVYTTVYDDGSKSMRTKTFYDAVEQEVVDESNTKVQQQKKKPSSKLTRTNTEEEEQNVKKSLNKQLVESNQRNVRQTSEDQNEEYNSRHESTVEETRRVSKKTETSAKKTIVRKESLQEENVKSVTSSKDKKKKSKKAPPPPADFPVNDTTTVTANKVSGGSEYTYSTVLENGKTITTSKTIYEEEDVEMTEEEIQIYKKQLKDAEKHKNLTTTKKLKSQSGTKKVVPSENPGEVTTVETIKIEGGTEYHYTTVTAEGIVKKAVKTVYDPVPKENPDDSDEEEIIEDYEEEIIEPGEKIFKTIETVKTLPQRFDEIVEVSTPKKKSTKLSRTDTQEEESRIVQKKNNEMSAINQQQSNVRKMEHEEHTTGRSTVRRESKVEETRSITQKIKISGNY